jgi:predicted dehydrogenase
MLKICLVGYKGYWGQVLKRSLEKVQDIEITALADISVNRSLTALLNLGNIDAVIIATPPDTHFELASKAILDKKHVLIEKPMTTKSHEAKALIDLANANGVKIGVDHTFLFSNHIRVMKAMLDSGEIGKVLRITSNRMNLGKFQDSGVVWDLMPHDIAMTNYLMSGRAEVKSAEFFRHIDKSVVDTATINMTYGDVSYNLNMSWLYPKKIRTTIVVGTNGMIEYDMLSDTPLKLYDKKAKKVEKSWVHSFNWISEYQEPLREPLQTMLEEFRDYCLKDTCFLSKGDIGLDVVSCIEQTLGLDV